MNNKYKNSKAIYFIAMFLLISACSSTKNTSEDINDCRDNAYGKHNQELKAFSTELYDICTKDKERLRNEEDKTERINGFLDFLSDIFLPDDQ